MSGGAGRPADRVFGVLGVPTSAGSHNAGQERAPKAWRRAGLGAAAEDAGDLPVQHPWTVLTSRRLSATPAPAVRADPAGTAAAAWDRLAGRVGRIVLHVDVDVLDTGAFPLANYPHFNGLSLDEARRSLEVWVERPELAAVVLTEVNPTHDPDGALLAELRDVLVAALVGRGRP